MHTETQSQRELAKYKSGEWTLQQLADVWMKRTWAAVPDTSRGLDPDFELGGEGTWDEILTMMLVGKLTREIGRAHV